MQFISSMLKRLIVICLITYCSITIAQTSYDDETHDFGLRTGTGFLYGIGNSAHPLVDISADYYLFSSDIRMVFGVSYVYPNKSFDGFSVAGMQYLGLEYNFDFLKNKAQIGVKTVKTYLKDRSSDIKNNRNISLYLGYKHPLSQQTDYYIQLGVVRSPVREVTGVIEVDDYNMLFRTGLEFYF